MPVLKMKNAEWEKLIRASADPARVRRTLDLLRRGEHRSRLEKLPADAARVLVTVLAGSQTLGEWLLAHPPAWDWLEMDRLQFPRRLQGLQREVRDFLESKLAAGDENGALAELRRFKQREMFRIAARDLARLGDVAEITRELSDVADVCLDAVLQICSRRLLARLGQPFHQDPQGRWQPTAFCVLGLGKLGGRELNYSSDVDLMFVYSDEGQVFPEAPGKKSGRPVMSNHPFFCKLAEQFVAEVSRVTPEGFLFRVDLRLRPEGDAGPICRSLDSYENYYAEWGRTWERMMLIKARRVAGEEALASEFLEMIQPFRFPRSVSADILSEIADVKRRIEKEIVGEEDLARNVKLGRGGIREIEFIAQALQVLHAGRIPFLQESQTLLCLQKLAQYRLLSGREAEQLEAAYRFLREVEHRLQMEANRQTHIIPPDAPAQRRLARLMNFRTAKAFHTALRRHTDEVRRIYDKFLKTEAPAEEADLPREFDGAEEEWKSLLAARSFRDPQAAFSLLKEFAEGPGYLHVPPHTVALARRLIPKFLALCPTHRPPPTAQPPESSASANGGVDGAPAARGVVLSDPDRVLTRLDSFIAAYGARGALMEMWSYNPALFELMLLLFDRSEFLAEAAIRDPDLVDDLVAGGRLRRRKTAAEILADLRHGHTDADQHLWLRRYHQTERMRLGLRDILGLADFEQNLAELSALAEACLQYAVEVVMRRHKISFPPFAVIGFGKLGGREIDYGSDLDVVFVADSKARNLPKLQKLAAEVMDLLSRRTDQGIVFHTDARLRPDGEKGLLVNTLNAFENYYRHRAQLWEIQALTRARFVAGAAAVGAAFENLAAALTDFRNAASPSARPQTPHPTSPSSPTGSARPDCFTPDWKQRIHQMRLRIEQERTPRGKDELAIKTGRGGLMDAEFIAQTLCLENGWREPNTLRALERGRQAKVLPEAERLIENYRQLRRVEGILRRWSYEGETVLPDDAPAFYRVAVRCGFATPEEFRKALAQWRRAIREVYQQVFDSQ
ncbi:MAG TPA: hypothetical protein VFB55_03340 [Verrucomicrobiae bacterium]|nr:hypothetical protein [Verrucomicrobiae bacterium]